MGLKSLISSLTENETVFVAGTDTEIGKTYVSSLLVAYCVENNIDINPFKPISAGVEMGLMKNANGDDQPVNEDAYRLWLAANKRFSLNEINPIVYQQPIAPHIAAEMENRPITYKALDTALDQANQLAKTTLVEGAGGWHLPLNHNDMMSAWVAQQNMPVILVVGIRLGCLNHALLTVQAIQTNGCRIIGWVANYVEGQSDINQKNVEYLTQKLANEFAVPKLFEVKLGQTALD